MKFNKFFKLLLEQYDFDPQDYSDSLDKGTQAMFATMWVDWVESNSHDKEFARQHNVSGMDILEIAPRYTEFLNKEEQDRLEEKIYSMISSFEEKNDNVDIIELYHKAIEADELGDDISDTDTLEWFIFMILMRMVGSGIRWEDDHTDIGLKYPYAEVSYIEYPDSFYEIEQDEEEEDIEGEEWKDSSINDADWWKDNE